MKIDPSFKQVLTEPVRVNGNMQRHDALGMGRNFVANFFLDVSQTDFVFEEEGRKKNKKISGFKY